MPDPGTLATVASIISAFGAAMLFFRIQREINMKEKGERVWLPMADWLLVAATLFCLLLVIIPLVSFGGLRLPTAAAGTAAILVAGYVLAIMAHYRIVFDRAFLIWGAKRIGPRDNPEPSELILACFAGACAALFFLWRVLGI
jgi:hypothetical protein